MRCLRLPLLLALSCAPTAWAQTPSVPAVAGSASEAQWLKRLQGASQRSNYVGTIVFEQGGEVRASRIVHRFDGSSSHERLQMLDGKPREFIRRDDVVQCLYPQARRMLVERRAGMPSFPALSAEDPAGLLESYRLRLDSVDRVAGHDCQWIVMEPRDALRFGYRLCVERVSGLLLKAQTLDARSRVLEQMAFSEVRIGERIDPAQLRPSWSTEGWRVEQSSYRNFDLGPSGWQIDPPAGFRQVRALMRVLPDASGPARETVQVVYSDGIATLSVFIEPKARSIVAAEAASARGATHAYLRTVGEALVTVVGEVPAGTVQLVGRSVRQAAVPAGSSPAAAIQ